MAAAVGHVTKRGQTFQYSRRVPKKVQENAAQFETYFGSKALFRVSLRTKDKIEMHLRCVPVHLDFERRVAAALMKPTYASSAANTIAATLKTVTQEVLNSLSERYRRITVEPFERAFIKADTSTADADEYERILYDLELFAVEDEKLLDHRGKDEGIIGTPSEIASWVIGKDNLDAPEGSAEFGAVVGAIRSGIRHGRNEIQALTEGKMTPRLATKTPNSVDEVPTLAEVTAEYLAARKLPPRTETEVKSTLRLFEALFGNKRLDALTRRDFQDFAQHLANQVIGGKSAGSIVRTASSATVNKRIGLLRAVINHAKDRDRFNGANPAEGINVDAYVAKPDRSVMPEKRRFKIDELNLIFQHPWFTGCHSATDTHSPGSYRLSGAEFWVPIMGLLTGCRASELGGLMLSEVMLDSIHPHFVIRDNKYRRTKGAYARNVPILDQLMELGFADYVQKVRKAGADRLFPDWEPPAGGETERNDDKQWSNGRLIRAFNRTLVSKMLGDRLPEGARQEVTFHSLRGTFTGLLGNAEYRLHPNLINEVVGHAKSALGKRYVGKIPIEETYPAIRACRYSGLVLPDPPPLPATP